MRKKKPTAVPQPEHRDPVTELMALQRKMTDEGEPDERDITRFRKVVHETPAVWSSLSTISESLTRTIVNRITDGTSRAVMLAEVDVCKAQLGYDTASGLERLLIDSIATARVRLFWAEHRYTERVCESTFTTEAGMWWDHQLSSAHSRFLRAVETLGRVRRLARNTPALQVNIAGEGGKQVNVQGDLNRQTATVPAEG